MLKTDEEIRKLGVARWCPRRRYNKGRRPGMKDATDRKRSWIGGEVPLSARDKKYLIAVMIAELVKLCFKCHIYEYGGEWYIQYEGGPIGLRLSGAVASIVMMIWDSKVTEKMSANEIELLMYGRYVDDGNYLIRMFRRGWRWSDEYDRMIYKYEYEKEDDELNEEDDVRVMREVRKLANSIWDWIECTEEVGSKFEDGKLPILDLKVYCVG